MWSSPINPNMKADSLIGEDCDIEQSIYYDHCRSMDRCIVCNGNRHCEWCPYTGICNPTVKEGCHCPNVCIDAIDPNRNCNGDAVVMGSVDNVAPNSKGIFIYIYMHLYIHIFISPYIINTFHTLIYGQQVYLIGNLLIFYVFSL